MKKIKNIPKEIVTFGIIIIVGSNVLKDIYNQQYPNRYRGFWENLWEDCKKLFIKS